MTLKRLLQSISRHRVIPAAVLVAALAAGAPPSASAQDTLRAVALVNDQVISALDLGMRIRLSILSSGIEDSPEVRRRLLRPVLRVLIDEWLKIQEAERLDITVSEEEVADAMGEIAGRYRMTAKQFDRLMKQKNILPSSMERQVRADLSWRRVINRRFRPSISISEDEVDEVIARIEANRGRPEIRVSEIFLEVDSVLRQEEVQGAAERLMQQLRDGGDFAALARQFSQSATASVGGDLGWIREGELPDELASVVRGMRPGELVGPISTFGGFNIVYLRDQRQVAAGDAVLHLKQIHFAVPLVAPEEKTQEATANAARLRPRIVGCDSVEALAAQFGSPGSGDLGRMKLSEMATPLRRAVGGLSRGQTSQPVRVSGGVSLFTVCDRQEGNIDRDRIQQSLIGQRYDMLARRYLRDLRRAANVDYRL